MKRFLVGAFLLPSFLLTGSPTRAQEPAQNPVQAASVPAQELYRGWPDRDATGQFYGLSWGQMAFNRASLFGQPVLFVLTVNWSRECQRLATETLVDPDLLNVVNQGYVTVLVNADLRPDIRDRYQTGSWPAMAFLLPNGKPMLSQVNDTGKARPITTSVTKVEDLEFLLKEGGKYWKKWPDFLFAMAEEWFTREGPEPSVPGLLDTSASEQVARWMSSNADRQYGGFGAAPKFVVPFMDEFAAIREARSLPLLRRHSRLTLERVLESPLWDARDGGVHRIATAPEYGQIQYEKMLTGNVHLVRDLLSALRSEPSDLLKSGLEESVRFLHENLARDGGGFYFAQVADYRSADGGDYWRKKRRGDKPPVDALVLSGPNALAGAALLRAGLYLDDRAIFESGRAALELVLTAAYQPGRGVIHAIEPTNQTGLYLQTQADVAFAFVDAYESTGDHRFLDAARGIADFVWFNLHADDQPMFFDRLDAGFDYGLLANRRYPLRGNVRMARVFRRLALHGAGDDYHRRGREALEGFTGDLNGYGVHGIEAGLAVEEFLSDPLLIDVGAASDGLRRHAVLAPWAWTLVRTSAADEKGARVQFAGESRSVDEARALTEAIESMTTQPER